MYYELLILGRLMYGPYHGYLIAAVMGEMIGPWQKVSAGTLYPSLARLARDGLIMAVDASPEAAHSRRTPRVYAVTDAGRARFHELMLDTTSSIGDYQRLFHLKAAHLEFLAPAERVDLLEHYRDYCRAALRHREKNTRDMLGWLADLEAGRRGPQDLPATKAGYENAIEVTRHMTEQWRAELAWVERLLEREFIRE